MKKRLIKREITICVSVAFVLYGLYVLLGYWFGWIDPAADVALNVFFPALAFGYMWFIARQTGPWWALPVLLFCLLIEALCEMIGMFSRHGYIDIALLWVWMQGPKLWWPIIGYAIGILCHSFTREKVTLWISIAFVLYALYILLGYWFGWAEYTGGEQWILFPAAALIYMCFIALRYGPLWALPALLFCMPIEIFSTGRNIEIAILWNWMDGPTLWGPVIGYVIGSLIHGAVAPFRAAKKRTTE